MANQGSPSKHPHVTRIPLIGVNPEEESLLSPYDRRSEVYRHLAYEHAKEHPPLVKQPLWTVPNALTFLRLVLVPVLMVVWYTGSPQAPLLAAALFVVASLTDWLDGWIARQVRGLVASGQLSNPAAATMQQQQRTSLAVQLLLLSSDGGCSVSKVVRSTYVATQRHVVHPLTAHPCLSACLLFW
jgi:hypothetical protein